MDYREAIEKARKGEEQGFSFLYEKTYKSKYYLALQYMKNKEAAEDVLQEAYMKAFSKLDKLSEPEAFEGWLGTIVANTAKNALVRKNPLLFTDVAVDNEGEEFTYDVEDENPENQPEMAYTREETRELVHSLMDSLSEEQRMCILMFHIEGASISEIAEAMDCSENTVKSRLNYGRKNLKVKAEELQKKGYKLYSVAPVVLLVYLLRSDREVMAAEKSFIAEGKSIEEKILRRTSGQQDMENAGETSEETTVEKSGEQAAENTGKTSGSSNVGTAKSAGNAATKAAKVGFFHTAAGKAAAVVVAVCVAGGAAYGVVQWNGQKNETAAENAANENINKETETSEVTTIPEATATPEATVTPEPTATPQPTPTPAISTAEPDYPSVVEGSLTKDELQFVLSYGPETIPEGGFSDMDIALLVNSLCQTAETDGNYIEYIGYGEDYSHFYRLSDVNRMFSSFTDYQFTEENDNDEAGGINVQGEYLGFVPATLNYTANATITGTETTSDELDVFYTYHKEKYSDDTGEMETTDVNKKAIMRDAGDGKYRIVEIVEATGENAPKVLDAQASPESQVSAENAEAAPVAEAGESASGANSGDLRGIYEGVLTGVQNGEYDFPNGNGSSDYYYFVSDINGDGVQELGVAAMYTSTAFYMYDIRVFTCNGSELVPIQGDQTATGVHLAGDGNGLLTVNFSRGTGMMEISRISIQDGTLVYGSVEQSFRMDQPEADTFNSSNPEINWISVSDTSGLDALQ